MAHKFILCLDFDGVIHRYDSGWRGVSVIPDPPVDGAADFLREAAARFKICIYSSRSKSLRGRRAMRRFMRTHFHIPLTFSPDHTSDFLDEEISYPWFKPPAMVTLDDRAMTFTGKWPTMRELEDFSPWNRA